MAGAVVDGRAWLRTPDATETAALLWQAAIVTVIGFVCWYMGMQRIGAERATLLSGLIPVAAACRPRSSERAPTGHHRPRGAPWSAPESRPGIGRVEQVGPPGLSGCRPG